MKRLSQYEKTIVVLALREFATTGLEKAIECINNDNLVDGRTHKCRANTATSIADDLANSELTIG